MGWGGGGTGEFLGGEGLGGGKMGKGEIRVALESCARILNSIPSSPFPWT